MTYHTGCIAPVPTANKDACARHAVACWEVFRTHGAARMVEAWGVDLPRGKVTDFHGAVEAAEDETVVFSWIEWTDKAAADAAWRQIQADPAMAAVGDMPFDGRRMIFGGFEPVFTGGTDRGAGYLQGFVLAVPDANKAPYVDMARGAWDEMFKPTGCLGIVEAWGVDVPQGKQTDFYRARKAEAGEVAVLSWTAWPDRATCDAASRAMEASMEGQEHPAMPFDGMRMIWGGFDLMLDTDRPF